MTSDTRRTRVKFVRAKISKTSFLFSDAKLRFFSETYVRDVE